MFSLSDGFMFMIYFGFVALSSLTSSQSSASSSSFPLSTTRPSPSQSSSAGAILDISIVVGPPVDVEGRDAEVGGVGPVDVGFETVTSSVWQPSEYGSCHEKRNKVWYLNCKEHLLIQMILNSFCLVQSKLPIKWKKSNYQSLLPLHHHFVWLLREAVHMSSDGR